MQQKKISKGAALCPVFLYGHKYRSGRENGVADYLSCCYDKKEQMCAEDGHSASQKEGGDVGMPT